MKKLITALFFLASIQLVTAQEVQWAFKVLEYSSQKESKSYSAKQIVGKPNVLPANGQRPTAWQPKGNLKEEFIKVGFLSPLIPKQILIGESFHPGAVSQVFVYDASGKEQIISTFKPRTTTAASSLLSVNTSEIDYPVFAVKVVFRPIKNIEIGIDAIGITESNKTIEIKINHSELIKSNLIATKLDSTVNSHYQEFGPLLAPDGKTLYFGRREDPSNIGGAKDLEDIWFSTWDEQHSKWQKAQNMGVPLNNTHANFINSISPDGNTILLGNSYLNDGKMNGGASISTRTNTGWSFPKRILIEEEENINEKANFYLANSQKVLLMSVERKKDNIGDRDIYVSFLKADSSWTKPLNLGNIVNTIGTEAAPFLAADERTLYYTSTGLAGYGGSDIYVTRRLDDSWTKWSEPENLGPIVNTAFDESYFTISAHGNKMYYCSENEHQGDFDMYTLELPKILKPLPVLFVRGKVLDSKTGSPLPLAKIVFENLTTGIEAGIAMSSPMTGEFGIVLPIGTQYGYLAEKTGYVSVHANLDLTAQTEYADVRKDLLVTPIETGQIVILNNVFFDFNKFELRKESYSELDRVVKLFKSNPTIKIEVSGHTDNVGLESYNDLLSYNRANEVVKYLIAKANIQPERIVLQHYGEAKPIANNKTESGRQLNRRVEFKILKK